MIRRGDEIRIGPVRIAIPMVRDENCEVNIAYNGTRLGSSTSVPVVALEELRQIVKKENE